MITKHAARVVAWLLLLVPLAVTSTPPSISWDIFEIDGTLVRAGGSPADHTIVLVYRYWRDGNRVWFRLEQCDIPEVAPYGPFVPVALTESDGTFSLRVATCGGYVDTLAVAVVYPDSMLTGTPFTPLDLQYTPIMATGHREDPGFLCDDNEGFEYERARIYHRSNVILSVP